MTTALAFQHTTTKPTIALHHLARLVEAAEADLLQAQSDYPELHLYLHVAQRTLRRGLEGAAKESSFFGRVGQLRAAISSATITLEDVLQRHPKLSDTTSLIEDVARQFRGAYECRVVEAEVRR